MLVRPEMLVRFVPALALLAAGCNPPVVYDPRNPVPPNINDRSEPKLELRVYYDGTRFDSVVKPDGVFYFNPGRCIHVPGRFRVVAAASDLDGGIGYLNVSSPDILPIHHGFVADPVPEFATQADDPTAPAGPTHPNPGMSPGSHTVEVTYYTGGNPPGHPRGAASLEVTYDLGSVPGARLATRAQNTSVSASTSSIDAYFVRPADAAHKPGSTCTPPP